MVKRRKTSGTSGSKAIDIKEERSLSETDDVSLARDRLKGVLLRQGRRDAGDESSDSGHDDTRGPGDNPNQPSKKSFELSVKVETEDEDKPEEEVNDSDDEYISSDPENDLAKVTYKMPPPLPVDESIERYPNAEINTTDALQNLNFDDPQAPSKESLLEEHLQRWAGIRGDWIASSMRNEERYAHSGRILQAIYKRAQKAYENS